MERIHSLSPIQIHELSDKTIDILTDCYKEPLVRELICQSNSNMMQKLIVDRIRIAFDNYYKPMFLVQRPDYLDDIQVDIECGGTLKKANENDNKEKDTASNNSYMEEQCSHNENHEDRNEELKSKIDDLEGQLKDMKDALSVYEQGDNIELHDKVRLELLLRFIEENGIELQKRGNKARAARLLQMITELPSSTCRNYMTNRDLNTQTHNEEILKINTELQALGISVRL